MKIIEFQNLMKKLYFHQDSKRGIQKTFAWLIEEVGELAIVFKKPEINLKKASEELADIIAWTASLANLIGVDLESALFEKYPYKCSKCDSSPCRCEK